MDIRFVTSPADKQMIYKFRYKIYIEEMNRFQEYANHTDKLIKEPLDDTGYLLAAYDNAKNIIGTARHNYAKDGNILHYPKLYNMHIVGDKHPLYTSITTKLMIAKKYRGLYLAEKIITECYKKVLKDGMRFNFIDVNDHLVKLFIKFGYKLLSKITHPEYGEVNLMYLDIRDAKYLCSINSPFYAELYNQHKLEAI